MGKQGESADLHLDMQVELARRIAAAWIGVKLGITAEAAYQTHCLEGPPGEDWMNLARLTELVGRKIEQAGRAMPQASQQ